MAKELCSTCHVRPATLNIGLEKVIHRNKCWLVFDVVKYGYEKKVKMPLIVFGAIVLFGMGMLER